jgi:acyl-CoA thioesterase
VEDKEKEAYYREIIERRSNPSTYYGHLGMYVEELGEGASRMQMSVDDRLFNAGGVVHGGALASIADAAIAAALSTLVDLNREKMFTVEMKVNYMAPIRDGEIVAEARIIQRGKSVAVGESSVYNSDGRLAAKAIATYMIKER